MLPLRYTAEGQFFNMNIINIFKNRAIWSEKHSLISSIIAGTIVGLCLLGIIMPQTTQADFANNAYASYVIKTSTQVSQKAIKTIRVVLTAYSSSPEETDDTPFITASGKTVADGIIANNMLPFGTQIRIPDLYGDKVFIVEDRMNRRKSDYHVDIWFPSKQLAVNFGVKTAEIEVLEN
ncbi:MAG: 3D domain-containing protein [Candidatus Staskawiczbacteria bacterium]|nr:3D domain-containing protein [Candidatus Staskawiczbacteria bacterium]